MYNDKYEAKWEKNIILQSNTTSKTVFYLLAIFFYISFVQTVFYLFLPTKFLSRGQKVYILVMFVFRQRLIYYLKNTDLTKYMLTNVRSKQMLPSKVPGQLHHILSICLFSLQLEQVVKDALFSVVQ